MSYYSEINTTLTIIPNGKSAFCRATFLDAMASLGIALEYKCCIYIVNIYHIYVICHRYITYIYITYTVSQKKRIRVCKPNIYLKSCSKFMSRDSFEICRNSAFQCTPWNLILTINWLRNLKSKLLSITKKVDYFNLLLD